MDKLLLKVKKYMEKHGLLSDRTAYVVGLSGGADSVCLLHMLAALREERDLCLAALHVHHGIRGEEAERDLEFSRRLCETLSVPFYEKRGDVPTLAGEKGWSVEEAGRYVRYEALEELRQKLSADYVAVAHHRDDNVETILHQMFRGSGLKGLRGIQPKKGSVVRPLLCLTRREIESWLVERSVSWQTDGTNGIPDVTRNKIRLELIPWLEANLHPRVGETLLRNGENLAELQDFLEEQAAAAMAHCVTKSERGVELNRAKLREYHVAVQKEVLYTCLTQLAGTRKDFTAGHIRDLLELIDKQCGSKGMLPYGLEAEVTYEGLVLGRREEGAEAIHFSMVQEEISQEDYKHFRENDYTKCFDYDRINCCLELRTRRSGDRICVYQDGRSKKLQDFFVDAKVPAKERDKVSLVAEEDRILWVVGYRVSEAYKVTEETKRIMKITLHPLGEATDTFL